MSDYKFREPPARPVFELGPLTEGDYSFTVVECGEPYRSKAGNLVLPLRLRIEPSGISVFSHPWQGVDKNGEERDQISEFLLCINRAPDIGREPDWPSIRGAKGMCYLRSKIAEQGALAGKPVNVVHYFHTPKEVGPPKTSFTKAEFEQMRKNQEKVSRGPQKDDPDSIPF
jgi:hypothetical protein